MIWVRQTKTYRRWEQQLRDLRARAAIAAHLLRLANGLVGDAAPVGGGVSGLRIHYGPGYRIYFQRRGDDIVILLCGGDKSSQSRDTQKALQLAADEP